MFAQETLRVNLCNMQCSLRRIVFDDKGSCKCVFITHVMLSEMQLSSCRVPSGDYPLRNTSLCISLLRLSVTLLLGRWRLYLLGLIFLTSEISVVKSESWEITKHLRYATAVTITNRLPYSGQMWPSCPLYDRLPPLIMLLHSCAL